MKISEIYQKYNIPPNLQEHMLSVTKVALFISSHWIGEGLSHKELKRSALVHDLGNIVKFDFDKYPEFMGLEIKNIDIWKDKQRQMISKYGNNDHEVTKLILKELKFSDDSIEVIGSKSFTDALAISKSDNFNLKVLLYADMRVLPLGIGTLEDRLHDLEKRYSTRSYLQLHINACREIEKQLQEKVNVSLASINSDSVKLDDEELLNVEI